MTWHTVSSKGYVDSTLHTHIVTKVKQYVTHWQHRDYKYLEFKLILTVLNVAPSHFKYRYQWFLLRTTTFGRDLELMGSRRKVHYHGICACRKMHPHSWIETKKCCISCNAFQLDCNHIHTDQACRLSTRLPHSTWLLTGKEVVFICLRWIQNAHSFLGITSRTEFYDDLLTLDGHTLIDQVSAAEPCLLYKQKERLFGQ